MVLKTIDKDEKKVWEEVETITEEKNIYKVYAKRSKLSRVIDPREFIYISINNSIVHDSRYKMM